LIPAIYKSLHANIRKTIPLNSPKYSPETPQKTGEKSQIGTTLSKISQKTLIPIIFSIIDPILVK
jgi:hypothetical protein